MFAVDLRNSTDLLTTLALSTPAFWGILTYHTLLTLLSLFGNLLVLYGTHRYNAIDIDAISLVFVKCLAVTDICIALVSGLPILSTLVAQGWVLGEGACLVLAYLVYIPGIAQSFVILEFTLYKLVLLLNPMEALIGFWTPSRMGTMFGITYVLVTVHVGITFWLSTGAVYVPAEFSCNIDKSGPELQLFGVVSVLLISFLPPVLMIIVNVVLLVIAGRAAQNANNQPSNRAIAITLTVSWVYVISILPKGVMNIIFALKRTTPLWLVVFQKEVFFVNTACNPVIYTALNERFREFASRRLFRKIAEVHWGMRRWLPERKRSRAALVSPRL